MLDHGSDMDGVGREGLRRPDHVGLGDGIGSGPGAPARGPLHQQITLHIARQIETGELPPGSMLLPEIELARRFGVSRQTVRAGLDALVRSGQIERRRGHGTVVRRPTIEQSLSRFYSVAHTMQERGANLTTQVLARGRLAAGDELGAEALSHLRLTDPAEIGYLLRLRLVDATPLLLETIAFPAALCPDVLEIAPAWNGGAGAATRPTGGGAREIGREVDLGAGSFYDILAERTGIHVGHARETFRPIAASGYEARLLQIAPGTPVFEVERVSFASQDSTGRPRPVEWRRTLARGDHFSYVVELANPSEHGIGQRRGQAQW